jgi:excisionase family DNA binding protein
MEAVRQYLTPREMAKMTWLSVGAIRRAIANGEMSALWIGRGRGGAMHVRRAVFERWLLEKEHARAQGEGLEFR